MDEVAPFELEEGSHEPNPNANLQVLLRSVSFPLVSLPSTSTSKQNLNLAGSSCKHPELLAVFLPAYLFHPKDQ